MLGADDPQFLKWKMEQVWRHPRVARPNHVARWHVEERGYRFWWTTPQGFMTVLMHFSSGARRASIRGPKPKGKGFSFLPKNYRIALALRCKSQESGDCRTSYKDAFNAGTQQRAAGRGDLLPDGQVEA